MFVRKRCIYSREEEFDEEEQADGLQKVLVGRCLKSQALSVHAVPATDVDEAGYVADCVIEGVS